MSDAKYDLTGIGNALVDVLAKATDEFIEGQGDKLMKGGMTLIDTERANELYDLMGPATEVSGGSAANTMAGFASFGGKGGFIGKVSDDQLGQVFRHDLKSMKIAFETEPLPEDHELSTGRCLILVTPDAERTMNTYLGAGQELCADDIEAAKELIENSKVTYLEGYLFDKDHSKDAFRRASEIAHNAGREVSLTLSDSFCVDRHRDDFKDLVKNHVDILFANEDEIKSLYLADTFEDAAKAVQQDCKVAVITRGKKGAVVVTANDMIEVDACDVEKVVDTTGAGDQFAAGFLYGYTQGMEMHDCARLGALAAAEVISHIGPRPQEELSGLIKNVSGLSNWQKRNLG